MARNNLTKRIRRREDEEDVLQSMYKSFCLRQQRGEFDLAGRDALWKLLVTITLRKARNAAKAQGREKRDVAREQTMPVDDDARSWAQRQIDLGGDEPESSRRLTPREEPAGTPAACMTSDQMMALRGATSDGFSTIVQPAAMPGATLQTIWLIGQFHGVIRPTTPIGSRAIRVEPSTSSNL